jgi:hypothetical protein
MEPRLPPNPAAVKARRHFANEIAVARSGEKLLSAVAIFEYLYFAAQNNSETKVPLPCFRGAILSAPVCRLLPSLPLGIHRVSAILFTHVRNRILAFHALRTPGGSLAMQNSPTRLRHHTNA